ncbi:MULTISPECIES: hypothetical protein [Microbacterium]|uniref:hypothetical protein n=1 Tax=Microbacterium TaxID=33882 RepID=UPI0022F11917|nr:hypothetical protein [Streptomyces sp. MS2A]
MATYGELDTIIGQMKKAAIDCWMADQDFDPTWGNADWSYNKWGWAPYQYRRPAADGSGGGQSVGYGDGVTCEAQFDEIRSAIDSLVERWKGLPTGSAAEGPQGQNAAAAAILGSGGAGPSVQNSGEISDANNKVYGAVQEMKGLFVAPFLMKYCTKTSTIQSGLAQANVILHANYSAQAAMWTAVRNDVATICDNARKAWKTQAETAAAENAKFQLSVAGAVVSAIAAVVTAPTGLGVAVGALATVAAGITTAVAKVSENAAVEISGNSYSSIYRSTAEALNKLNESITAQERALNDAMTEAMNTIHGNIADYNLDAVSLGDIPATDGTMQMDRTLSSTASSHMVLVDEALAEAHTALGSPPGSNPTPRSSLVGVYQGTHTSATALWTLTARCLELTSAEYSRGRSLFDATVEDYFSADASAKQKVAELLADEALTTEVGV